MSYSLRVIQETLVADTLGGRSERPGHFDVVGTLVVLEGERNLTNRSTMTLLLQDDRQLDFLVLDGTPVTAEYSITLNGRFE